MVLLYCQFATRPFYSAASPFMAHITQSGRLGPVKPQLPHIFHEKIRCFSPPCHCFHEGAQLQYIVLLQTGDGGYCTWNCPLIPFGTSMESCGGAARYGRSWLGWETLRALRWRVRLYQWYTLLPWPSALRSGAPRCDRQAHRPHL